MTTQHDKANRWQFGLRYVAYATTSCAVGLGYWTCFDWSWHFMSEDGWRERPVDLSEQMLHVALVGVATMTLMVGIEELATKLRRGRHEQSERSND